MSDIRSPFPVPAPRDDDASGGVPAGPPAGQGRKPAPWPMPEHAQPSPSARPEPAWPELPGSEPAVSGRENRREHEEEAPGEVTAWGYPVYQEPRPSGPLDVSGFPGPQAAAPQAVPGERPFSYWESSPAREPEPASWGGAWGRHPEEEPRPAEEPEAPPARKKREPYLDNVKFVLITLVVAGHSLVPTFEAHSAKSVYLFIYTFHMPAFVLISGYLGRNFWNSNAKINKLVDTMLVPYVIVEIGYALLRLGLGQKWTLTIIDPAWLNWYLLALVLWRISTPIWHRMRQPLLVAVIIYMVAGFSEISGDFSLDRFFGLLPFYVLGLMLKPEHFDLLKPLWVRITAGIVTAAGAATAIVIAPHVSLQPVYFRYSFKKMDMSWWVGLGVRGAILVAALVLSVALLALVPRRETWFSDLGTRTLYAYLLHGVVVLIAKDQGWLSFPWLYGPLGVLAIMSSSVALAIVLCLPETRTAFKWLLEPRLVWLYRRPSGPPAGKGAPAGAQESSTAVTR
ncbi:acyltransferase family protein [Planomonospora sp. ID67723]|uniref:acyltransferase family protein n=1 Tax=Planomonospora sp. ID67723 TaxID=2738134 RepID=UPI0018C35F0A|nr:acyltransferase family protein [Planomonospora sp. ID67723]MBG0828031.1 acyltransferase family protein [Planomonospora sp. ID67723]